MLPCKIPLTKPFLCIFSWESLKFELCAYHTLLTATKWTQISTPDFWASKGSHNNVCLKYWIEDKEYISSPTWHFTHHISVSNVHVQNFLIVESFELIVESEKRADRGGLYLDIMARKKASSAHLAAISVPSHYTPQNKYTFCQTSRIAF